MLKQKEASVNKPSRAGRPMALRKKSTRDEFIRTLISTGNVRFAASSAGINYDTAYSFRSRFPSFAREWDAALEIAADQRRLNGGSPMRRDLKSERPRDTRVTSGVLETWAESLQEFADAVNALRPEIPRLEQSMPFESARDDAVRGMLKMCEDVVRRGEALRKAATAFQASCCGA